MRIADFKCGPKIASGKCDGNLFVNRKSVFYWLIGTVIAATAMMAAFHFDHAMVNFIAQHQDRLANKVMNKISHFGDWPEHFAIGLLLAGIAWWRGCKKWTRIFLAMLIALALAGLVARVVKIGAGRARPAVKSEQVWEGPRLSVSRIPFRAYRGIHSFFCCLMFCELADRSSLSADPNFGRFLAHVRRRALSVRCRVCGSSRNSLRHPCCASVSAASANRKKPPRR